MWFIGQDYSAPNVGWQNNPGLVSTGGNSSRWDLVSLSVRAQFSLTGQTGACECQNTLDLQLDRDLREMKQWATACVAKSQPDHLRESDGSGNDYGGGRGGGNGDCGSSSGSEGACGGSGGPDGGSAGACGGPGEGGGKR